MNYAFLDGDDVGLKLEALLRAGQTQDAATLSRKLREALVSLERLVSSHAGAELILFGGDDFLIKCDARTDPVQIASKVRASFSATTGLTMSGGIGGTVTEALDNLRTAKNSGKDRLEMTRR